MREEHLETSAPSREPFKDVLLRNLDTMAAVLGLVILGLSLFGLLLGPPEDLGDQVAELDASISQAQEHLEDTRFSRADHEKRVQAVIDDVHSTWGPLEASKPATGGLITWPELLVKLQKEAESNEIVFPAPQDSTAKAEFGSNRVTWTTHEDNNVPISGFRILRKVGEGALAELAVVGADVFQYDDRDVSPGKQYTYRIVSLTEEPTVVDQVAASDPSEPATVNAVADFKVSLEDVDLEKKIATFKVEKWHNENWFEKRFTHRIGDVIGRNDAGSGVNYTSGRVMRTLDAAEATEDKERLEVVFDGSGKVLIKDGAPVTEKVVVTETFQKVTVRVEGAGLPPETLTHEKR